MTAHDSKRDHCYSHRGVRCNHVHTYMLLSHSIGERVQLVTARAIRLLNIVCQRRCQSQNVYVTYVTRFLYPLQHTQHVQILYLSMAIQLLYTASWPYSFFIQLLSYGHVQLLAVLCFIYGAGPTGPVVPFSPASALCLAWSRRTWRGRRGTRGAAERHAARRRRVVLIGNIEEACEPPQHRRVGAAPFLLLGGLVQPRH